MARWILARAARRLGTPELADDAAEIFAARARDHGERHARRWYRRQAGAALLRGAAPGPGPLRRFRESGAVAGLALDLKLAARMLVRYPGLTVVGGLSLAFAVFVGAGLFEFVGQTLPSWSLPLPAGERVAGIRLWDVEASRRAPIRPADLAAWREELTTVERVGGFETVVRSLSVDGEGGEPLEVARMSPAGFRLAGTPPLLGRTLVEADAAPGASPVVVVGHRIWQVRFGGDPGVVGRTVRVGARRATVVGVMPEGFRFPVRHQLWVPLPADPGEAGAADAPADLYVFGRLAPGVGLEEARAEASAVAARTASTRAADAPRLEVQVLSYRASLLSMPVPLVVRVMLLQVNAFAALFLVLVAANVALLVFARAAARERELLVRTALGASRARVVAQLFVEALVLSGLAAAAGLAATGPGLAALARKIGEMGGGTPPFWFSPQPSPTTVAYAVALAVLAAAVSGVVPGLQTTRRRAPGRLRSAAPGAGGLRLGRLWNGVVAAQVGITVVFTGGAFLMVRQAHRSATVDAAFPADRYLSMELRIDGPTGGEGEDGAPFRRRYAERVAEVASRLAADPAVAAVTLADRLPLTTHPSRALEVEGGAAGAPDGAGVRAAGVRPSTVAPDFFEAFGARVVAGRGFGAADARSDARPVVVDRFFVERFLGGRSAPGRRVRYVDPSDPDEPGPWHTIVGVVEELEIRRAASLSLEGAAEPHVYHPLDPAQAGRSYPLRLAALVPDGPDALAPRVHRIAADVGPDVQIHHLLPLDRARAADAAFWELWAELLLGTSAVALFLSLAGIYAVMSFTVARRTREIGVRVALGAEPPRVVADVFRTPLRYVGVGVVGGCAVVAVGVPWVTHGGATVADVPLLVGGGLALAAVCAAACIVPTLRALRVEPARALSAEG